MWHVTCDPWREGGILSSFQVYRSYGLGVKVEWWFSGKEWISYWIIYLSNKLQSCFWNIPSYTGSVNYFLYSNIDIWIGVHKKTDCKSNIDCFCRLILGAATSQMCPKGGIRSCRSLVCNASHVLYTCSGNYNNIRVS